MSAANPAIRGFSQAAELFAVSILGGWALAATFLNASHLTGFALTAIVPNVPAWFVPAQWGFLALTLVFWLSSLMRRVKPSGTPFPSPPLTPALTFVVPVVIALLYGWLLRPGPSLVFSGAPAEKIWHFLLVPIGEELLFRGWFYNVVDHRFEGKMATLTNPLPCAAWASSLAFAIWHLQNWDTLGPGLTIFQFFYTGLAGLWLALLRWRSGRILYSILGHAAINLSASLI